MVLQSDPNQIDMLVALGIVELKAGKHQEAIDFFVQALAIEPNYAKHMFYGHRASSCQRSLSSYNSITKSDKTR